VVKHVWKYHGQPLARAHSRISRCPHKAVPQQVHSSQGTPFSRNSFRISKSARRRSLAKVFSTRQLTSPLQALQSA
jgi:hypothetical protein